MHARWPRQLRVVPNALAYRSTCIECTFGTLVVGPLCGRYDSSGGLSGETSGGYDIMTSENQSGYGLETKQGHALPSQKSQLLE